MEHIFTKDDFEIHFEALPEDLPIEKVLSFKECGADHSETIQKVQNGELEYFVAHVTAVRNGIRLAEEFLGGNIYENEEDFYKEKDGYFKDMTERVIEQAHDTIKDLCEQGVISPKP